MTTFEIIQTQQAWQLAIERSYRVMNKATIDFRGFIYIQERAKEGNPIAQAILAEYIKARME